MVVHSYAAAAPARNFDDPCLSGPGKKLPPAMRRPSSLASAAMRSRLLCACDVDGRATIDDLVRAIPDHPSPLLAVVSLVDEGWLRMDRAAAFGATTEVRRSVPR